MRVAGTISTGFAVDARLATAAVALAAFLVFVLGRVTAIFPADLSALWMAGHLHATGQPGLIYAAPEGFFGGPPPDWLPLLPALGLEGQSVLPYVYPPLWAVLMAPVTEALGPFAFFRAAAVAELAMLAGALLLAWRLCRGFALPLWLWLLAGTGLLATSVISYTALMHLQPQIVVVFLTLMSFERLSAGRSGTAGAVLALAAALKLAPLALALIFVVDRDWRALGSFAAVCTGLALLGLGVAGVDLHLAFLAATAAASEGLFVSSITWSAELLLHGAAAALGQAPEIDPAARNFRVAPPAVVPFLAKALGLAALGWMLLRTRRLDPARRLPARLFLLSLLVNLFGPLGWSHYYLMQLFLLPMLITLLPRPAGPAVFAATALLTSWPLLLLLRTGLPGDYPVAAFATATMATLFLVTAARLRD